ncbi:DUF2971 domain-containing protein [Aliivibrio sifiae]|uniref:DUF2971 domain-containing protein n=1 Tax=Aliivibrio sifiae TaxID=566293 RepID=A0A2S7X8R0_9GAMM|nr:DUF2971 domain-containing protein [Aliivibrio sifiae]PQJ87525.1 hypothetical protein BTO23_15580 [Aliivibrio sifiae]GLR77302.1 hypothetical protein GCM10007855_41770 [Aliivibrio sifiae]
MSQKFPEYLYHYTSFEALACILEYKTFRFTKLNNLNDPLEGKTADLNASENLAYCSSWTAHERDTIPLWKMYSGLNGVRLKLPSDLFTNSQIESVSYSNLPRDYNKAVNSAKLIKPIKTYSTARKIIDIDSVFGPDEVEYLDSERPVNIEVVTKTARVEPQGAVEGCMINLTNVGLYKNDDWAYEKEWRYRLLLNPLFGPAYPIMGANEFCEYFKFAEDYIDVPVKQSAIDRIEVMLGPMHSAPQRILLTALLEKYSKNFKITESNIQIK